MEHLGDDVDHEIKQVAAGNSPVQGLVLVQGVQRKIPGIRNNLHANILFDLFTREPEELW